MDPGNRWGSSRDFVVVVVDVVLSLMHWGLIDSLTIIYF